MKRHATYLIFAVSLLLSCGRGMQPTTPLSSSRWTLERLYFGRAMPSRGQVSEQQWRTFLQDVVTPRFPTGITVWRAEGQWRDPQGRIVREQTFLLELAHPADESSNRKLQEVISEYKACFRQESVLRVSDQVNVTF